jgi:hypothetical protein
MRYPSCFGLASHGACRVGGLAMSPRGGVAQLGERLVCNQEAIGSIPFTSTSLRPKGEGCPAVARSAKAGWLKRFPSGFGLASHDARRAKAG